MKTEFRLIAQPYPELIDDGVNHVAELARAGEGRQGGKPSPFFCKAP